jgi:hypothetical protein
MTENQKNLEIYYRLHNGYGEECLKGYLEQEVYISPRDNKENFDKIGKNTYFKATLRYNGFTRGRSALNI